MDHVGGREVRTIMGYIGLGVMAVAAVAIGSWFGLKYRLIPFIQLPGIYDCGQFGVPDNSFNRIEIDSEFKITSVNNERAKAFIGELRNYDGERGRIELTMEMVHTKNLTLEPLTRNLVEGTTLGIRFVQLKEGHETSGAFCKRLRKLEPAL